ncbi:UPF0738 family protein [Staphylococcus simiae]|uniref:UPF0738 protein SS7213T_03390 n=1 Tax=Staphylococcus simiae CCM 7213 = CCUG 51256 TaxID=911238 RepID=G5JGV3_9STAP|nr:hypothetical protein [Staphylococcus simiae]EHJ08584.1 hypothetical protein SS7213T_03390 [Staphylococcus simiae CCM 7213 = CCUG 51256]PNZ10262.1 hypothetical protein CD113_10570 [Staphylococcus simiae]SNV66511.1 Uncharacterised protein [Staphylococcus simiae]
MRIYINEIKVKEDGLYCYSEDSITGLKEVGQMLVDSDNYAFAYTLDDGKAYSYLIFVQETWTMLHENMTKKIIINDELELTEFHQELNYILDNIKGNNNYGKEFVATVEDVFNIE